MSDHLHAASSTKEAMTTDSTPDARTIPPTSERPKASSSPATRTWAWGRTREPYDWMDAHTPFNDMSAWRG
ncbi:hypothetical protein AWB75_05261 [Caballeronia catudaia]|uniref:Uncharacterized protein n=1 Tax=Caballeronia catudaia TaxID=1777136 RepID=A0A158CJT5_9BURK|nr:hypothetical protein [Caballeronia catudaia]SAK82552.1 hypothetical protein AWB75_05261 [Caballeronia catudaia]